MKKEDLKKVIQKLTLLAEGKSLHRESAYSPTINAASIAEVKLCIESVAEGDIDVNILECVEKDYRPYTYADADLYHNMYITRTADSTSWKIIAWCYSGVMLSKEYGSDIDWQRKDTDTIEVPFGTLLEKYTKKNGELLGVEPNTKRGKK